MSQLRRFLPVVIPILIVVGIGILIYRSQIGTAEKSELKVAASIFPIYDLTRQVAGNKIDVELLLPPGASEHDYEPTLQDKVRLENVSQVFVIGAELDEWVLELVSEQSDLEIVDLSSNIELRLNTVEDEHEEVDEHIGEEGHGLYDPHYWLSVANAQIIVTDIKDSLVALDPDNASYYEENASNLQISLGTLQSDSNAKLAELDSREIITFHEAFAYFASENGLEVVATVEPYPGQEPSLEYMAELGAIIREYQVDVIFSEPQLSDALVQAIKTDYDLELYTLDPVGGIDGRNSYQELIRYNVDTIYSALKY